MAAQRPPSRTNRALRFTLIALFGVLLASCQRIQPTVLDREPLFDLEIGRLEDHVDLIARDGVMPRVPTSLAMREGILYIGDGNANKIMEFTSFGDLVGLVYHPQQNPTPVTVAQRSQGAEDVRITRIAEPYSFGQLGHIAVDSQRRIFAEDRLSAERAVFDENLGVQLNRIVVRFDETGQAIDYLGQEGIGGTPFPFIMGLRTTLRDELAVITSTMEARYVYLFSPTGELIYTVRIGLDRLPVPSEESRMIAVLEQVDTGIDAYRIYVKVSYYQTAIATDTGKEHGISFDHSRIYWIDLETGTYEGFVELPNSSGRDETAHWELIGVAREEHLVLLGRSETGAPRLIIMNDDGRVLRRRTLEIPETDLVVRQFALAANGVLSALLGYPDRVELVWWRTDRLLPTESDS